MLATTGVVYTFHSWGRPYSLRSRLLSARTGEDAVKQVEAGWGFCAALTHAGHVLVWWPGSDPLQAAYDTAQEGLDERVRQGEDKLKVRALEGTKDIPCHVFELEVDPVQLDDVPPNLPDLPLEEGAKRDAATRIVKIAGADNVLIALTNGGHVLKYSNLIDEASHRQGRWEYVGFFMFHTLLSLTYRFSASQLL
jgi:SCF-associated factor 1